MPAARNRSRDATVSRACQHPGTHPTSVSITTAAPTRRVPSVLWVLQRDLNATTARATSALCIHSILTLMVRGRAVPFILAHSLPVGVAPFHVIYFYLDSLANCQFTDNDCIYKFYVNSSLDVVVETTPSKAFKYILICQLYRFLFFLGGGPPHNTQAVTHLSHGSWLQS